MDYSKLGLNSRLQADSSLPANREKYTKSTDFDSENDRGVIKNSHLKEAVITTAKIGTAQVTDATIESVSADKIAVGTVSVAVNVGTGAGSVILDGGNNRIVINDGTNDRILIGYQSSGF